MRALYVLAMLSSLTLSTTLLAEEASEIPEVKVRDLILEEVFDPVWFAGTLRPQASFQIASEREAVLMDYKVDVGVKVRKNQVLAVLKPRVLGQSTRSYLLLAPSAGIVTSLGAERGAIVRPGEQLLTLENRDSLHVEFFATYEDSLRLNAGQNLRVFLAPATEWEQEEAAKLEYVEQSANATTGFFKARLVFECSQSDNPTSCERLAKSGSFVKVLLRKDYRQSIVIASNEFSKRNQSVFVVNGNGEVVEKEVKIGSVKPNAIEIVSGLAVGDRIITSYKQRPIVGGKVQIVATKPQGKATGMLNP